VAAIAQLLERVWTLWLGKAFNGGKCRLNPEREGGGGKGRGTRRLRGKKRMHADEKAQNRVNLVGKRQRVLFSGWEVVGLECQKKGHENNKKPPPHTPPPRPFILIFSQSNLHSDLDGRVKQDEWTLDVHGGPGGGASIDRRKMRNFPKKKEKKRKSHIME